MSPLTPLLILLVGTIGLLFGVLPRFRYTGLVAVAAGFGALAALLLMALSLPARATLSAWEPLALFGVGLSLEADGLAWLFALGVLVLTLATLVTGLARPGGRRVGTRIAMLLLAMASLGSIFAENLLTRILAWAFLDVLFFLALILLADGDGLEPQAVLNLAFNSTGTLLAVGAALLISRTSSTLSLRDAALTPQSTLLMTLAVVFRLGLFPLHLGLPTELNVRQGLGTLLRLIPAAAALETMSRLAVFGIAEPLRPWLTVFAAAAAVVGALQLWNISDPRRGIAYIVIAQSGIALLAGLWGGAQASMALAATSVTLMLGAALVFLTHGYDEQRPWPTALPLIGAAAMAGAPLTLGFLGVGQLYATLVAAGGWGWLLLAVVMIAQAVLIAGLLYTVFWPGQPMETEPVVVAIYFGGLSLPAILLVMAALFSTGVAITLRVAGVGPLGFSGAGSVIALILVAITVAGGVALWHFDRLIRERAGLIANLSVASLARLDWLYRLVWTVIHGLGTAVENLAGVLEGEGAILWMLVASVLVWLIWRQ